MLRRAGYAPKKHIEHLERMQHHKGADAMKLGAVSGQQYKDILRSRAFDEFFFQIPAPKGFVSPTRSCRVSTIILEPG